MPAPARLRNETWGDSGDTGDSTGLGPNPTRDVPECVFVPPPPLGRGGVDEEEIRRERLEGRWKGGGGLADSSPFIIVDEDAEKGRSERDASPIETFTLS